MHNNGYGASTGGDRSSATLRTVSFAETVSRYPTARSDDVNDEASTLGSTLLDAFRTTTVASLDFPGDESDGTLPAYSRSVSHSPSPSHGAGFDREDMVYGDTSKRWCNFLYSSRCPFSVHHSVGDMEPCKFAHIDAYARLPRAARLATGMPSLMTKHVRNLSKEMMRTINSNARRGFETHLVAQAWGREEGPDVSPYLETVTHLRQLGWFIPDRTEWSGNGGKRRLEDAPWWRDIVAIMSVCTNVLHYGIKDASDVVFATISWVLGCDKREMKYTHPPGDLCRDSTEPDADSADDDGERDASWLLGDLMNAGVGESFSMAPPLVEEAVPEDLTQGTLTDSASPMSSLLSFPPASPTAAEAAAPAPVPPALSAKKLRKQRQKAKKAEAKAQRAALAAIEEELQQRTASLQQTQALIQMNTVLQAQASLIQQQQAAPAAVAPAPAVLPLNQQLALAQIQTMNQLAVLQSSLAQAQAQPVALPQQPVTPQQPALPLSSVETPPGWMQMPSQYI
eukprot:TRINITY_DN12850_c0_g1_i1.p1 TRINITY_DN12850_c0_g1~~TRINITY_DN12850_c0_g1_i1.p1  ORF type:complete len:511 (+),score=163.57 TRINITY_DN12850_c0_g1_i1:43-1575(+)